MIVALSLTLLAAEPWIAPELQNVLTVRDAVTITPRTLWWSSDFVLERDAPFDARGLFAVHLARDTDASALLGDTETLLLQSPTATRSGFALVRVHDPSGRDALAKVAHHATGRCGAIESLSPEPPAYARAGLQSLADPPVHDEAIGYAPVRDLLESVDPDGIAITVAELEAMGTRFHGSTTGRDVPGHIETMVCSASDCSWQTSLVPHDATPQPSLIAALPGVLDDTTTVVVGAHLDSIAYAGDEAPGADDDATGVATLVELVQAIHDAGARFERRVEFHFYAAEEIGLVGSGEIAASYRARGRTVSAMLQCDMNGYTESDDTIHLITNDTDSSVSASLAQLADTYLGGGVEYSVLSAGSSDHRSWTREGYAAAFATEDPDRFNGAIHSAGDTSERLDPELSARFARLGLAFVAHHAGLILPEAEPLVVEGEDLKVAITAAESEGGFNFAVATRPEVTRVRLCRAGPEATCADEPMELSQFDTRGDRVFFVNREDEPMRFGTEEQLLLQGFGFNDEGHTVVLHERELTVRARPE